MSNGSQSKSWVTSIELQNNQLTLTIQVAGFEAGESIELSGYATQSDGGFATFYEMKQVDNPGAPLTVIAPLSTPFKVDDHVTVVLRAAKVWVTVLKKYPPDGLQGAWASEHVAAAGAWGGPPMGAGSAGPSAGSGSPAGPSTDSGSPTSPPAGAAQLQLPGPPAGPEPAVALPSRVGPSDPRWSGSGITSLYHGRWWDRIGLIKKADLPDAVIAGRYTKLFPDLRPAEFAQADLEALAEAMTPRSRATAVPETEMAPEEDRVIPAAYTYLGQFIDHDITFDPTSSLREFLDLRQIHALKDYRTPRFDLDSLYGRGPADQPYLYQQPDGVRMLPGEPMLKSPFDPGAFQVPRGPNGRALIGDPRNDENRIVSQLHAIFLRFHNRIADHIGKTATFPEVREQVRWHYQWMLVTDFLPTVIEEETFGRVFGDRYHPVPGLPELQTGLKLMPVEFSVAAYRFGHSMIRPEYRLNADVKAPIFSRRTDDEADLAGFRPIPSGWAIDWQLFINLAPSANPTTAAPLSVPTAHRTQHAYKIDTSLASPLRRLPTAIAPQPSLPAFHNLAFRNLERGNTFGLPSGQDVAVALGVAPIPDEKLMIGKATATARRKPLVEVASGFAHKAPLWTYILSEAQVMSWADTDPRDSQNIPIRLGPVGSRIIADVFAALLIGDRTSFIHNDRPFRPVPEFTRDGETFGLAQLINVALGRTP